MNGLQQLKATIDRALWEPDLGTLSGWRARWLRLARLAYVALRDVVEGPLSLHAMSLVYTTLLSLVPLLAVSFSLLQAFGVHNQLEPVLQTLLEPLGPEGALLASRVVEWVENIEVGVLGAVGLGFLIYTVIALLQKVEEAFNAIWHVRRPRTLGQRFSDYLSVVIVGPVLVFTAIGVTASIMATEVVRQVTAVQPIGFLLAMASTLLPYVLVILGFAFIYGFMPNTRVRVGSAFVGAILGGVLWQTTGWLFGAFMAGSTRYAAIYSAFAVVILFMLWLYVSWMIVLLGGLVAFYHQHPQYLTRRREDLLLSSHLRQKTALHLMRLIGVHYYTNQPPWTAEALMQRLNLPGEAVESVLDQLQQAGLLRQSADSPPAYLPARPPETTLVRELLHAVHAAEEQYGLSGRRLPDDPAVEHLSASLDRALADALQECTLKDLAQGTACAQADLRPPTATR